MKMSPLIHEIKLNGQTDGRQLPPASVGSRDIKYVKIWKRQHLAHCP